MTKTQTRQTPQILNRKARFEFIILDRHEAGIALMGTEVKSLRQGRASLEGAYARIDDGEVWLVGCNINTYEAGNLNNHEPMRPRKLLLHRREIRKLTTRVTERGLTLIPTKIYFSDRGLIKVEVALARGKNKADKREDLKSRDQQREMARATAGRF
jgi:SsrA-binding protein